MLKIESRFICRKCDKVIEPYTGFIVQGNVYVVAADVEERAGIIGNAFPFPIGDKTQNVKIFDPDKDLAKQVDEVAYHKECLMDILDETAKDQIF